jgi:hypothetical protein
MYHILLDKPIALTTLESMIPLPGSKLFSSFFFSIVFYTGLLGWSALQKN